MTTKNKLVQNMFLPALPLRGINANKGEFGKVAIVGGDSGMIGAVLLAARAALLCGAGRVYAFFLAANAPTVDLCYPELMLKDAKNLGDTSVLDCVVIGTGIGQSKAAVDLLDFCLAQSINLLIDADALNLISLYPHVQTALKNRQFSTIITPHPAEAARLLNVTTDDVQANRLKCAQKLANEFNVICVLKGAGTIIVNPAASTNHEHLPTENVNLATLNVSDSNLTLPKNNLANKSSDWFINTTGNPGLATGGTGDVLSGIIGSLVAQGLDCLQAAKLGVYVHGAAADALVANGVGPVGLTASEIVLEVRAQINLLNNLSHHHLKLENMLD